MHAHRFTFMALFFAALFMRAPRLAFADDELASPHEPRGSSWVSVAAFADHRIFGEREVGAMATVGMALDRAGPALTPAQDRTRGVEIAAVAPLDVNASRAHLPVTRDVARGAVAAAWRASGLGVDDDRLDSMISRARISALLPETRLRAMRKVVDQLDEPPPTSTYYYPDSVDTWLEARFTWRLDRLVFVDEEPSVERLRIDRTEARVRVATRVLAVLSEWQRAWVDLHTLPPDAPASLDSAMRMADAEASLDVFTAGWFSRWRARTP